ncbi:MAG: molybdate ABC transporter substrate-binding protein [Planctomycetota bacterium]
MPWLDACGGDQRKDVLDVYAASSLQDALKEVNQAFARAHGVKVNMNNGSSGKLSVQIELGGNCDVFLSAGDKEMDRLDELGAVDRASRRALLSNQLVIVADRDETEGIAGPEDLAGERVKRLSLANPDGVPAGRYARTWLQQAGVWERVQDKVLPASNVRAALAAVTSGGAEAGVVYRTDAAISDRVEIVYTLPPGEGPEIRYPVAAMLDRPRREQSELYVAFLGTDEALQVFRRHGFLVLEDG